MNSLFDENALIIFLVFLEEIKDENIASQNTSHINIAYLYKEPWQKEDTPPQVYKQAHALT
jgi:hypothetical protein